MLVLFGDIRPQNLPDLAWADGVLVWAEGKLAWAEGKRAVTDKNDDATDGVSPAADGVLHVTDKRHYATEGVLDGNLAIGGVIRGIRPRAEENAAEFGKSVGGVCQVGGKPGV
jgi:hypothetical protein